jgi:hypothetical protein
MDASNRTCVCRFGNSNFRCHTSHAANSARRHSIRNTDVFPVERLTHPNALHERAFQRSEALVNGSAGAWAYRRSQHVCQYMCIDKFSVLLENP